MRCYRSVIKVQTQNYNPKKLAMMAVGRHQNNLNFFKPVFVVQELLFVKMIRYNGNNKQSH